MTAATLAALHTPAVRDLAWLLSSASPWQDAADIEPARLLGAQGWPQLLALDAAPQPLLAYLAAHPVRRLGFYAERLLAFWFGIAPHIELVAANLPVRDGGKTVGEFDFLLRVDGVPLHLEAASKFYLQLEDGAWVGASLRDALLLKAGKTRQQLQLSRHPAASLPDGFAGCEVAARTSGSTAEISNMIGLIQSETRQAIKSMDGTRDRAAQGVELKDSATGTTWVRA